MLLTKLKITEIYLMNKLDDKSLCVYAQSNKLINKLYNSDQLWRLRIREFFGKEYLKFIDDNKNWVKNYIFIKGKYCHDNGIDQIFFPKWNEEKFNLALNISYNFDYHDIEFMIKKQYWSIFDKLPFTHFNNQIKIDIYYIKNNNINKLLELGYKVSDIAKKVVLSAKPYSKYFDNAIYFFYKKKYAIKSF